MMKLLLNAGRIACLILFVGLGAGQSGPPALPAGQVMEAVVTVADSSESYALYLPSAYTAAKRWPIIYAFDPVARGRVPVKLFQAAAEKYGYIIAGSNTSRNFSLEAASKGANAMWQDTHTRLSIDDRQVYVTGFSGGARVAGMVAMTCAQCKIAGVIAHGAGYPISRKSDQKDTLQYFLAVGTEDFNWPEVVGIRRDREENGLTYRVQVFNGPHQWAPVEVIQDAVEWIHLKAMQSGAQAKDEAFIEDRFRREQAAANESEEKGDALAELSACRSLVSDFSGLKDVSAFETKLAILKKSPQLKTARKKEQELVDEQFALAAEISPKLARVGDAFGDERVSLRREIYEGMTHLKDQGARAKSEERGHLFVRTFSDLSAQGIEAGQAQFEEKQYAKAEFYFQLMSDIEPDEAWPPLLLAETHTAMGNRNQAIKDVRETIKRGVKNAVVFEQDRNLQGLRDEPEFQKLLAELKAQPAQAH